MNLLRRFATAALVALLFTSLAVPNAHAATITQTQSFSYTNFSSWSSTMPLNFARFDPSQGTLQSVTLSTDAVVPANVTLRARYAGDTLNNAYITARAFMEINGFNSWAGTPAIIWGYGTFGGGWQTNSPVSTGSSTSLPARSVTFTRADNSAGFSLDDEFSLGPTRTLLNIGAQVAFDLESLNFPTGLPYVDSISLSDNSTTMTGNMTVTYAFQPVPEPSAYAMALAGLGFTGFSMWRRRKRA